MSSFSKMSSFRKWPKMKNESTYFLFSLMIPVFSQMERVISYNFLIQNIKSIFSSTGRCALAYLLLWTLLFSVNVLDFEFRSSWTWSSISTGFGACIIWSCITKWSLFWKSWTTTSSSSWSSSTASCSSCSSGPSMSSLSGSGALG